MAIRLLLLQRSTRTMISPLLHLLSPHRTLPLPPPAPPPSSSAVLCKVIYQRPVYGFSKRAKSIHGTRFCNFHTSQQLSSTGQSVVEPQNIVGNAVSVDVNGNTKVKRPKLKGKRAVVRWLKHFRWKKEKEYERMTAEEKILFKLRKAQKKEVRLVEALRKIEPPDASEPTHDPEILTPEEHFYFLKMGHRCKNYVPVGRRGIFQGVILNMHLHWKKHQTLKVVVKTFTPEEVREIAVELARLSGGIVLEIHEENTIIMYRGKNYSQPPAEIMSPRISLPRKKALDKSKYRDALRAVRRYIPKLHQGLEDLQVEMKRKGEDKAKTACEEEAPGADESKIISLEKLANFGGFEGTGSEEDDPLSGSEDLSDIFETDSEAEAEAEEKAERHLYLDQIERFPMVDGGAGDLDEHPRRISNTSLRKDEILGELDEIDKIFLRAGSLLKKKRR